MATAANKLSNAADFITEYSSRVGRIDERLSLEVTEAEQAATRARVAHAKARAAAEAAHAAATLERHMEVVVRGTIPLFRRGLRALSTNHAVGIVQTVIDYFRTQEAEHLRVLGEPIDSRILGVAAAEEYLVKHPEALGRLAFVENWVGIFDSGIGFASIRATHALRQGFDVRAAENALLDLDTTIKRVATAPGYGTLDPEAAKEIWDTITRLCLPGHIEEERRQALVRATRARNAAEASAALGLQYQALSGDRSALAQIKAQGAEALNALRDGAAFILHRINGRAPLGQEINDALQNLRPEASS